ncbi:MAG: L-ribulose-5-phosphate 4-epimerase [Fimbriimonadaceae bacterium]
MRFGKGEPEERRRRDCCALCSKSKDQVKKLIVGLHGAVCDECIHLIMDILEAEGSLTPDLSSSDLQDEVCWANIQLRRQGLVTMHSGNVSALDIETGIVLIKPSGVDYESLLATKIVQVNLETGEPLPNQMKPSVDLPHHLFLYRNIPEIKAIVHTHSNFATAFAACHKPIPCVLTAIADEFGGEIPCAPYVDNEGDHIGEAILKHRSRGPAILLGNHGVFAWGPSVKDALKAAIMVEDVARTATLAMRIGEPIPISQVETEKWWDRYHNRYGQS